MNSEPGFEAEDGAPRQYVLKGIRPPAGSPVDSKVGPQDPADFIHVRRYKAPNWATTEGVAKKRRAIERKGLPGFAGWKFVTLTLDPEKFGHDPLKGYQAGRRKLSKFMHACREAGLWSKSAKWCWKLEFQRNGWAHWHLLIEHRPKWTEHEFREVLPKLWGHGFTQVEAVRTDDYAYSFKYAFKPVLQQDDEDLFGVSTYALPDWFLDHYRPSTDGNDKPESFSRVRFWQTSKGFYTGGLDDEKRDDEEPPASCYLPFPARAAADRAGSTLQVVARTATGKYVKSAVVTLLGCVSAFWSATAWETYRGRAWGLAVESFIVPTSQLNIRETWLLKELKERNRLTPQRAELLPDRNWRTC